MHVYLVFFLDIYFVDLRCTGLDLETVIMRDLFMLPVIPTKSGDNMASKLTSLQSACKRSYAMIDSVKDYQARCQECGMFDEKEWHKWV